MAEIFNVPQRKYYRLKSKRKKRGRLGKSLLILIGWLLVLGFIGAISVFAYFAKDLPDPKKVVERQIVESTKIYDRTGKILLYDIHGEEKRTVIAFDEIPQYVKAATLVIEDDDFYHHIGLDFKSIVRAILANLKGQKIKEGGSTITQQFIKNSILTPERTFTRKIKEAILAIELERKYSKDEIFSFYLNQVPYGSNAYGIEAAANTFFDKHASELTLAEAALLAALPKAPSYFSPYGSHPEELKARQEYILDRMVLLGYISQETAEEAKKEELEFAKETYGIKAPHFVMYVKEYLEDKYGKDYVEKGGLKVYTTLDWDFQKPAEVIVVNIATRNEKNFGAYNAALVSIDPKTGQILTMVGSKDYFGDSFPEGCISGKTCLFDPNVNVAIRNRQPGSSFKPLAYATAFKKGYTPDTIIFDLPTEFAVEGAESYQPKNYDRKFRGPLTFRQALAQSINVASVKVLYLAGVNQTLNTAEDIGITTLKDRSRFGLSLVLGGGEIKLLEETAAFSVFADEGIKHKITPILKIENGKGDVLEEFEDKPIRVLEPQIARLVSDILSDEAARAPMFGIGSKLSLGSRPAAAKTGTTDDFRDGWTVGYTPSLVAGVWAGNNDNTAMHEGAGIYIAAPIWNEFMKKAYEISNERHRKTPSTQTEREEVENEFILPKEIEYFNKPDPIITDKPILNGHYGIVYKVKIDIRTGEIATEETPEKFIEEKIYREAHNILYYLNKNDPRGDSPPSIDDSQFMNWEGPVLDWVRSPEGKEKLEKIKIEEEKEDKENEEETATSSE